MLAAAWLASYSSSPPPEIAGRLLQADGGMLVLASPALVFIHYSRVGAACAAGTLSNTVVRNATWFCVSAAATTCPDLLAYLMEGPELP